MKLVYEIEGLGKLFEGEVLVEKANGDKSVCRALVIAKTMEEADTKLLDWSTEEFPTAKRLCVLRAQTTMLIM